MLISRTVRPGSGPVGWHPHRRAATLLDMLVVIGIVALMLALLIPSLSHARELSRRIVCANNLRQWGVALQYYRDDHDDYIPTEGTYLDINKPYTWFNELPPYLHAPAYKDVERQGKLIEEFPELHVWICPSKNLTDAYKSRSGQNQFHYGMNLVLDGVGEPKSPSEDVPGFLDEGERPMRGKRFCKHPNTVFMFDIAPNSPNGSQRSVATMYQWRYGGGQLGRFHGDYANILHLDGKVIHCKSDDLVTDRDFRYGDMIWTHPELYWGYVPPPE